MPVHFISAYISKAFDPRPKYFFKSTLNLSKVLCFILTWFLLPKRKTSGRDLIHACASDFDRTILKNI